MKSKSIVIVAIIATVLISIGSIGFTIPKVLGWGANKSEIYNEFKNINNATLTENIVATIQSTNKGPKPKPEKIAYLTFDDGPSERTSQIIDILNKHNVKGTFFMIERNMKKYPNMVKKMVNEGHIAGFHSVSHDVKKLYKNKTSAKKEFDQCRDTFYEITGKTSDIIRIPYGSKPYMPEESYNEIVSAGYDVWDWDVDTLDWNSEWYDIVYNTRKQLNQINEKEIVVLMHEKESTVKALEYLIDYLTTEGYTILPLTYADDPQNYWLQNLREK